MGSGAFLVGVCRYLGDRLVEAWQRTGSMPAIPPDEDPQLFARRLVAQQCVYGVDRNPYAVQLAKLSLWLVTLAREHPFTFLDHALRHGDSLVGLTRRQIQTFTWKVGGGETMQLWSPNIDGWLDEADRARERLEGMAASDDTREKQRLLTEADSVLHTVRRIGDTAIAAFFGAEKDRARRGLLGTYEERVGRAVLGSEAGLLDELAESLRERGIVPFHWEVEFPEVFRRSRPGFDAMVGNPPFLGGSRIVGSQPPLYPEYLGVAFPQSRGKSDLVAYFFRRAFDLLRDGGCLGIIATNTICEGDTRSTGLRWILNHEGRIFSATRRYAWPGVAAVVVSVLHIARGVSTLQATLDGRPVPVITAYLYTFGTNDDPARLTENASLALSGVNPNGKGFLLSSEQRAILLKADARATEVIRPFLGSVEMNESADAKPSRWIIALGDCDEGHLARYPAIYERLKSTVKIQRASSKEARLRDRWWTFSRPANELSAALIGMSKVLVSGRVATHHTFAFQDTDVVFSDAVTVFVLESFRDFAILQCRLHEYWSHFQGSSFKDDPRYIPEDCFETFPRPHGDNADVLIDAGERYYSYRATLMIARNEGLTDTYNRFHDPAETSADIEQLRTLHAAMDRAVLDDYGWTDLAPVAEFIPEFDEDDIEPGTRARRKFRLRWPDDMRDEVLARLLELNRQRGR